MQLLLGLLALSLSGYFLTHSAGAIADPASAVWYFFGLMVIAFATTLPEKLLSVLSGISGQGGIAVATIPGSNIFLLNLCIGIAAVSGSPVSQVDMFNV